MEKEQEICEFMKLCRFIFFTEYCFKWLVVGFDAPNTLFLLYFDLWSHKIVVIKLK